MTEFKSDEQIRKLATRSLFLSHLDRQFEARGFLYEGINDKAQGFYKKIASAISSGNPLAGQALKAVIDIVGDVVTTARNTSTAKKILNKLRKKILESYKAMHQLVLVSHSLGTIYSLDTINEPFAKTNILTGMIGKPGQYRALITMGSPLGLDIDVVGTKYSKSETGRYGGDTKAPQ